MTHQHSVSAPGAHAPPPTHTKIKLSSGYSIYVYGGDLHKIPPPTVGEQPVPPLAAM